MDKRKAIAHALSIALTTFTVSCSGDLPTEIGPSLSLSLQESLDRELRTNDGIGISAAVIRGDDGIWLGTSGTSHDEVPITTDMLFNIASITKTFVAAVVLQLVEDGALTLDDSLHRWLPLYPRIDSTITIQQLLNHTSGVYDYFDHPGFGDSILADLTRRWTPAEVITSLVLDPYAPPGTSWNYSNTNYLLLGMIVERVTNTTLSQQVRNRLLDPLDLDNTYFEVEEEPVGVAAHGWYDVYEDGTPVDIWETFPKTAYYSVEWAAGAMFATAEDVARYARHLFHGNVLTQPMLDDMLTIDYRGDYGLGIRVFRGDFVNGQYAVGHGGEGVGYRGLMVYLPDWDVSVAVLMNEINGDCLFGALDALLDVVLNDMQEQ